jgi:hypothetical protein
MSSGNGSAETATQLGLFFALIGGLFGYGANQGGGAVMGAIAGFALGVAVVRAVKYAAIVIVGGLGLFFAVATIKASWKNVQAAGTAPAGQETTTQAPPVETQPVPPAATGATKKIWVSNGCSQTVKVYIKWQAPDEGWSVNGPWTFTGGETAFLDTSAGVTIQTTGPDFYFYAEAPEVGITWGGSENVVYEGRTLPMQNADPVITEPSYDLKLVCEIYDGDQTMSNSANAM